MESSDSVRIKRPIFSRRTGSGAVTAGLLLLLLSAAASAGENWVGNWKLNEPFVSLVTGPAITVPVPSSRRTSTPGSVTPVK